MSRRRSVLVPFGTRPEVVKLAQVVAQLISGARIFSEGLRVGREQLWHLRVPVEHRRHALPASQLTERSRWRDRRLMALLARRPVNVATVALANKMARVIWVVLVRGQVYRTAA